MAWNLAVGPNRCDLPSQTSGISRMPLEQNTRKMEQHFNILSKMKQFRNEEKFCDAEVIVNGTTFIVHKTVLAAWSSVLASELLPVSIPNGKANIHVVYDNVEAFSDFLEFLYTGFVMVNDSNVEQLLHIGKHFNVEELVQQCENFLCSNVRLDNFVTNYFLSLRYSLSQLEEDISNFVQCNISQVIEQATFLKLTPQKFSTFIKTGKMSVAKQEIQFSLIAGWVGSEITTREKYLLSLLSFVKWINPVSDLLVQIQNTDNIFMVNELCLFQLLHNLYGVFGDALGAFTATYSKLLNHYKFKVPDLLNLPDIVNEIDTEMLDIIPISVTGKHDSENVFNSLNVFPNENNADKNKNNTVDNSEGGLEKQVEKSPTITTIEIGVNTDETATHVKEYKDNYSQTVLASSESSSCDTSTNSKTCESPNIDMDSQESTELQTKDSSKVSRKSKVHRRKSEPRKVVDNVKVKMKVENVGDGKIKLKTLPVVETPTRKRGRPRKSEPGRNNKHDKKKAKIKDEIVKVKQEHIDTDDNDNYNADTDDNLDLKAELELIGIQFDNTDNPDGKVIVPGDNEEKDETYKLCKDRSIKTKTYGKLKSNKKLRKPKRPYKPPSLPFKCTEEDCTYSTKTEARLEKHITSIHNTDIKLYCKKCDYVAPLMKDLCLHMKTHISGPPYRCDFEGCQFQVWRMGMLVIHQMNHLGERPYACDMCTKSFRTANQLSCHKKLHEGRKFVCDVCSKRFTTKGVMKQHRAIHFDKKEYLCDTCGFATKHQSHLISHRKIHTGDLVRCSFHNCNYATPKQGHMTQHLNQHLNIRNHMCQVCGKSFVVRSKLVRHEKIHLDHKLFKCKQCEYTTIRTDRMKLHLTTHGIVFQKKKFNQIFPDTDVEEEIDYHQFYEKIETTGTEMLEGSSDLRKQKLDAHDKPMDIVHAAMNAAVEGRLLETAYTMSMPRMQMDPISVAAVASLEEYTKMQSQVFPSYERMQTFQQL